MAEEVETAIGAPIRKLQEQIYILKRRKLEALITERLLLREAARRGISVSALLDAEVTSKAEPVTEEEVEAAYQALKAQLKGDEATGRALIRAQLPRDRMAARERIFLESLRSQAQVVVYLQPPPASRSDVFAERAPFKGAATAPVTIVE